MGLDSIRKDLAYPTFEEFVPIWDSEVIMSTMDFLHHAMHSGCIKVAVNLRG